MFSCPGTTAWLSGLEVHGYVDTYFGDNVNRPADGASFLPGAGSSAKRRLLRLRRRGTRMTDFILVTVVIGFFALCWSYVAGCDRM